MLPKNIVLLMNKEPRENDFISCNPRKGREEPPDTYQCLPPDKAEPILRYWAEFHSKIQYHTFEEFYDKEAFCEKLPQTQVSLEQFEQIICDRAFLFLHYGDQMKDSSYPSLTDICHLCDIDKKWDSTKIEAVRQQGFVPTYEHKKQYDHLQNQLHDLQNRIELRKEHIKRKVSDDINLKLKPDGLSALSVSQEEYKLAVLFHSYLVALIKSAYCPEYEKWLNNAIDNALPWIQTVYQYTKTIGSDQPCGALYMWCLFTTYTMKLAKGNLKEYTFRIAPSKTISNRADVPPEKVEQTQSRKIRCNIILFDHLLDLIPPTDLDYAKFQFYYFTRYDRFTHYVTSPSKYKDFNCQPNLTDGIDQLGCMIRYHIDHCLMNVPAWLTSLVPSTKGKSYYSSLAYLLLFDGSIKPTQNRLTDRIARFLDNTGNDDIIERYRACHGDRHKIIKLLDKLREANNLNFNSAHIFSGEETLSDPNITQCKRMVLEYAITERCLEDCRNNLRSEAEKLFPYELFLSKHVFWVDN